MSEERPQRERITFALPLAISDRMTEGAVAGLIGQRWEARTPVSRPGRIIGARREEDGSVYVTVEILD